jgi:hypothetical protein
MQWLNYHHLFYFWTVVREGSIARAARSLHLTEPTVSSHRFTRWKKRSARSSSAVRAARSS